MHGVSQAHAVPSRAEAHVLLHSLTVQLTLGHREAARGAVDSVRIRSPAPRSAESAVLSFGGRVRVKDGRAASTYDRSEERS